MATWQCSRNSPPSPPDASAALRGAVERATLVVDAGERGHHVWQEEQRFYEQPLPIYLVYFTAWEQNGALQTVPEVYGLDRRHTAVTNGQ